MRQWLFNLILLGAALGVAASLAELGMRAVGVEPLQKMDASIPNSDTSWGKRDEEIGWINNPGIHKAVEFGNAPMTFWEHGRRATRPAENIDCPNGSFFLTGDSWTQGYGVRDEDTYGWMLSAENPGYCFENFGNGGYGALQNLMLLERSLQKNKPAVVILGFTSYMASRDAISLGRLKSLRTMDNDVYFPPYVTLDGENLVRHAPYRSLAWPLEHQSPLLTLLHSGYHYAFASLNGVGSDTNLPTMMLIRETANVVRSAGSRFLFVWLQKDSVTIDRYNRFLSENNIEAIDCESPEGFAGHLQVGGHGHPNGEYHRLFAGCIQTWLRHNI